MPPSSVWGTVTDCLEVSFTAASRAEAERIGEAMVRERLAACARVHGPLTSVYWWRGAVERAEEWGCLLKTTAARWPEIERRIRELHSYEVPEIIALPLPGGSAPYLEWIRDSVRGDP